MYLIFLLFWFSACEKEKTTKSNDSELKNFSLKELPTAFSINGNFSVSTLVPDGTPLEELTAEFTVHHKAQVFIGSTIQASGFSKNNFTNPITYTVQAENGNKSEYTVTIETTPKIKTFSFKELPSVTTTIQDNTIACQVPFGTALNKLTAIFETSTNSTLYVNATEQISGTTQNNFSEPVTYLVKSKTGVQKTYTTNISTVNNLAPIADGGTDKLVLTEQGETSQMVTLNASASSDPENQTLSFKWIEGNKTLASEQIAKVNLEIGTHTIVLQVTDAGGSSSTDQITVEVKELGTFIPIDTDATVTTKKLLQHIASIGNSNKFIFGQEFPLSYQLGSIREDLSTSDCKTVTNDHPGVYGIDPHYMLYKSDNERQIHIDEAKHAYNNGSIVTLDFHQQSRTDHQIYMNKITTQSDKDLMYDIVHNKNGSRQWFYTEMDQIINIINNDLGFPVVFRLFHEMDGDWFWWGSNANNHSSQLYIDFYRLATNYIKDRTQLVLFAWSPNSELQEIYYPGDAYVDIVGFDIYEPVTSTLTNKLISLSSFAANHNKPAILAETGNRNNYVKNKPNFWTETILKAITDGENEIRIAWVLAWFNAPWKDSQEHLFIPNENSNAKSKQDFINFKNSPYTLFQQDVKALNVYQ